MKLFYKLKTFFWAAGLTGFLLLFHPVLIMLITRGRDLSQAATVDSSSQIQIVYIFICAFVIFNELITNNQVILKKMILSSPIKFLFLFNILSFISAFWSTNPVLTLYRSFECLTFLLLINLTIKKLLVKFTYTQVINWTIWFAFWNLFTGILFRYALIGISSLSIPFLPSRLFFPLFFFIIIILGKKRLPKIVVLCVSILGFSNKIFIGIALGFIAFVRGSLKNKLTSLIAFIILGFMLVLFDSDKLLLNTLFYGRDSVGIEDASGRKQLWTYLINAGLKAPYFGYGFSAGEADLIEQSYWKGAINSHNALISAFVNTGLVGLILIIIFFLKSFFIALKFKENSKKLAFLSTIILITIVSLSSPGIGGRVYGSWIPSVYLISLMVGLSYFNFIKLYQTRNKK